MNTNNYKLVMQRIFWGIFFIGNALLLSAYTIAQTVTPAPTNLLRNIKAISVGNYHSCALTTTGAVKCWGLNVEGALGDGTTTSRSAAVSVSGLNTGITAINAGVNHTCALTTSGGVKCWGSNKYWQLGSGTEEKSLIPKDVEGLDGGVAAIDAGYEHTCAVMISGQVKCWGSNLHGQLGNGSYINSRVPVTVSELYDAAAVSAGDTHTCALTSTGGAMCWGSQTTGQLGDGTSEIQLTPVNVYSLTVGVSAISAGWAHTCALSTLEGAKCWGFNWDGELGDGTTKTRVKPISVIGLNGGVTAIAAGDGYTCALMSGGSAQCWGRNDFYQLGNGTTENQTRPTDVLGLENDLTAISVSEAQHTCALMAGGTVKCWGANQYGQLGDGTNVMRATPVYVIELTDVVTTPTPIPTVTPTPSLPIVLVHGLNDTAAGWNAYVGDNGFLASIGRQGFAADNLDTGGGKPIIDKFGWTTNTIDENAQLLGEYMTLLQKVSGEVCNGNGGGGRCSRQQRLSMRSGYAGCE